jgi:hypothetical protein
MVLLSKAEADRLPDGSLIRRAEGPRAPYAPLERMKGLWLGPRHYGGIGSGPWEVLRVGPQRTPNE